jgi:subtilisin family serine protease/outer membrane protein OmpA-like peptidoglycan-associated protein
MDPGLSELLRAYESHDAPEIEAIIRLSDPSAEVPGVRIVSRFGDVMTCRVRPDSIDAARHDPRVLSLTGPRPLGPEPAVAERDGATGEAVDSRFDDIRRPPDLTLDGEGVVVGVADFDFAFHHVNFRRPDGSTRLLALWDQRPFAGGAPPMPYGYGTLFDAAQINRALRCPDPYAALGYRPAKIGHGTHVMDIAAGCGRVGPSGIAPAADLVCVHIGGDPLTAGLGTIGNSLKILEAVAFVRDIAGSQPWVVNLSMGRQGGPHDGCTPTEVALDALLSAGGGQFAVQSAGNYRDKAIHSTGRLEPGETRILTVITDEADRTPNEVEIWYGAVDEFMVRVESPTGWRTPWIALDEHADITDEDGTVGRIYHGRDDYNYDHQIDLFLDPAAPYGDWAIALRAVHVRDGTFHAWIERDEACPRCQAHFAEHDVDPATTTGTIANARVPLAVGAYDAHSPDGAIAHFSSEGPTRDGRIKPDLVAPGCNILAAVPPSSSPEGGSTGLIRRSGTSMATPHVTGAAALCLQAAPALTAYEIRELLLGTATLMPGDRPTRAGAGRLQVLRVEAAVLAVVRTRHDRAMTTPAPRRRKEFAMHNRAQRPRWTDHDADLLYRELVYSRDRLPAWITTNFDIVALPGEAPRTPPEGGDVLVRVALGQPGLGHLAVLTTPDLTRRDRLAADADDADDAEAAGTGFYATVTEWGAVPHTLEDRFARRIFDPEARMPCDQLLLRPTTGEFQPGIDTDSLEDEWGGVGEDDPVPMALPGPRPDPKQEQCRQQWEKIRDRLPEAVQTALEQKKYDLAVGLAIHSGIRDGDLLTNMVFFTWQGPRRGYCRLASTEKDYIVIWNDIMKTMVRPRLAVPSPLVPQAGGIVCVARKDRRLADPAPDNPAFDLTGRYEHRVPAGIAPGFTFRLNQAGKHLEAVLTRVVLPMDGARRRDSYRYHGDLQADGSFLMFSRTQPDVRAVLRRDAQTGSVSVDTSAIGGKTDQLDLVAAAPTLMESTLNYLPAPVALVKLHEWFPLTRIQARHLIDSLSPAKIDPFLKRYFDTPAGDRVSEKIALREAARPFDDYLNKVFGDRNVGIHYLDRPLARFYARTLLSESRWRRDLTRSHLDWIQIMLSMVARDDHRNDFQGMQTHLGLRPDAGPTNPDAAQHTYKVTLKLTGAGFFAHGYKGSITFEKTNPPSWPTSSAWPQGKVTFGIWILGLSAAPDISVGDTIEGEATTLQPWQPPDIPGTVSMVKGGIGVPGVGADAGFLHVYGSEIFPPMAVLFSGVSLKIPTSVPKSRRDLIPLPDLGGSWGKIQARSLPDLDYTTFQMKTDHAVASGLTDDVHFCVDGALLTEDARQALRIMCANELVALTSPTSRLTINGHTDRSDTSNRNLELSDMRAKNTYQAIKDILGTKLAIPLSHTQVSGKGETEAERDGRPDNERNPKYRRADVILNARLVLTLRAQ